MRAMVAMESIAVSMCISAYSTCQTTVVEEVMREIYKGMQNEPQHVELFQAVNLLKSINEAFYLKKRK